MKHTPHKFAVFFRLLSLIALLIPNFAVIQAAGPVIGQTLQVTSSADGVSCTNAYSYWPSFNDQDTEFFLACDNVPYLYNFNPATMQASDKRPLFAQSQPALDWQDAIWSNQINDLLYARTPLGLWSYNTVIQKYSLVHDFSSELPGKFLFQMSMSTDDNRFAFTVEDGTTYAVLGYIVYDRSLNKIIYQASETDTNEVQLDKSGRYLLVTTNNEVAGEIRKRIVDLSTDQVTNLTYGAPNYAPGHSDNGNGFMVGDDNFANTIVEWDLAKAEPVRTLLSMGSDWSEAEHISLLDNGSKWALVSFYKANDLGSGPYDNKLVLVATDGSGTVKILGNTNDVYNSYWDSPRADISRDGKFAVYTSDMGTARRDVFIMKIQ